MKNSLTPIICILICLVPTLMAGQALQVQKQLFPKESPLRSLQQNSMLLTGDPLLRISNIGSSGQDGVSIELNSLSLMNPGPAVLFDCPDPLIPLSGAIRLQPSAALSSLRLSNIGSSGQDGVAIDLGEAIVGTYRPRISMRKPLVDGTQSAIVLELGEDSPYLRITNIGSSGQDGIQLTSQDDDGGTAIFSALDNDTGAIDFVRWGAAGSDSVGIRTFFDLELPGLMERISSASLDSFFDVFYDLSLGKKGTGFGNNPNNICAISTFDPVNPSLRETISSNLASTPSFFDVFVDLNAGTETRRLGTLGDPDFDLLSIRTYDKATPKLLERIASASVDSFFDVFYDLHLGAIGTGFGQNPNNICAVRTFDPSTPSLLERISSNLPTVESFFDVFVDLELGTETIRLGTPGIPLSDLVVTRKFDKATPKLQESITSGSALTFFDITYELGPGHEIRRFAAPPGDPDFDLLVIRDYDRTPPRLSDRILSSNPLLADSFFDITYELNFGGGHGAGKISFNDLSFMSIYEPEIPQLHQKIVSADPLFVESFFDIFYNLDEGSHQTKFHNLTTLTIYNNMPTARLSRSLSSEDEGTLNWFFEHDLNQGTQKTVYHDLQLLETFDELAPTLIRRLESTNPAFAGRSIEERYDIATEMIPLHLTSVGFPGMVDPIEVRYEYDGTNRRVREITTDTDNGVTLFLDRRLSPTGPRLLVGGNLSIEGGTLTASPPGAPLILEGDVIINGSLQVAPGPKAFKIDHPLDPDNKYLIHSCIESPDMMNIYNGNVVTDANGYATIILPEYFEALNNDFRYQLTCMGQFAQAIVDKKIKANRFVIRTDKPNVEVSWQVTGIRHDPGSKRESYAIEIDKEPEMKGKRLYQQ